MYVYNINLQLQSTLNNLSGNTNEKLQIFIKSILYYIMLVVNLLYLVYVTSLYK